MEILTSIKFYIGFAIMACFFVLNEVYPMVPARLMPFIAAIAAVFVFLFYRDII